MNQYRNRNIYTEKKKAEHKKRLTIFFEGENIEGSYLEVAEISACFIWILFCIESDT